MPAIMSVPGRSPARREPANPIGLGAAPPPGGSLGLGGPESRPNVTSPRDSFNPRRLPRLHGEAGERGDEGDPPGPSDP